MFKLVSVSLITITCLYGLLVGLAVFICLLCGVSILPALISGAIVLIVQFIISPWLMDITVRWLYRADFNKEIPDYLKDFINEVCMKKGIKYPKIGIIDDGTPNCYTYGRTKKSARIIITRGIFDLLKEDEVEAVIGHELGHVAHYDMLLMTMAQLFPIVFYGIYEICSDVSSDDDDNKYSSVIAIVAFVLYIISQYIVLWLSRTREYLADSFSVEMTANPNALAEALVKIGFGLTTTKKEQNFEENNKKKKNNRDVSGVKGLGIFDKKSSKTLVACSSSDGMSTNISKKTIKNVMKWEKWNYWAKWYELNSTHPLVSKRLEMISKRSEEFKQEPYIVFDLEKTKNYFWKFLFEVLLLFLSRLAIIGVCVFIILMISNGTVHNEYQIGLGICAVLFVFFEFILFFKRYKKNHFNCVNVAELLGEVDVSGVTAIPCELKGNIIGRGDAGYIFNEDFVIRDETGIIFLDYNQPLWLINKIFAYFKAKTFIDKEIVIRGWYRRSPVPYVEIYQMELDGKIKKVYTYIFKLIGLCLLSICAIACFFI